MIRSWPFGIKFVFVFAVGKKIRNQAIAGRLHGPGNIPFDLKGSKLPALPGNKMPPENKAGFLISHPDKAVCKISPGTPINFSDK